MVKTIYVVRVSSRGGNCRHARTQLTPHGLRANLDPPPTGIDGDVSISAEGFVQAGELAAHLATLEPRPQKIYSSPFYRCLQTIAPAAERLGLPICVEPGLGEHYSVERPTHPVPRPAAANAGDFPAIDTAYTPRVAVSPDGETRAGLWERLRAAAAAIIADSADVDTLVIATHAAVKIALADVLAGAEVRAGTASLDRLDRVAAPAPGAPAWRVAVNGDTSYLSGGEQMHWTFAMAHEAGSAADEASRRAGAATARVLVPLDLSGQPVVARDAPVTARAADLAHDRPIVQIGSTVYEGRWSDIIGTELYTTPEGELLGTARERVVLEPVRAERASAEPQVKLSERVRQIDAARAAARAEGAPEAAPGTAPGTASEAASEAASASAPAPAPASADATAEPAGGEPAGSPTH